ncbi:MAG: acyl--CoA ligase [Nannocystis sp.]|nr:acyl--CoA ligase [Nannocystis sp.]
MVTLPHPLLAFDANRPAHVALRLGAAEWSARSLSAEVSALGAWLSARGVVVGETIAIVGPICAGWVIALHAIGWVGAVAVPIDPREPIGRREERLALVDRYLEVVSGEGEDQREQLVEPRSGESWLIGARDLGRDDGAAGRAPVSWPIDQARVVLFTSGSTGDPRPITLSAGQLFFAAVGGAIHLGHHLDDVWYACLPPWHVGGLSIIFRTCWCQTTLELAPAFDPHALAAAIDGGRITQVSLVPAMLRRLLEVRGARRFPPTLRWILLGGAAADEGDIAAAEALGAVVCPTWGMTETAAQVATRSPARPRTPGVVGAPLPFVQVSVDAEGRLIVDGPQVGGAPLRTQDRGEICPDGQVRVAGRLDRVVISGGRNIDPAAVERVLLAHPAVADVYVCGAPDERLGARLVAFVAWRGSEADGGPEALVRFAAARLHPHDRPRVWALLRALERGAAGKISAAYGDALVARLAGVIARRGDAPVVDLDEASR